MKKFKISILMALIIGVLLLFAGCGNRGKLDAPAQLDYNIENELSWSPVEGARGYYIEIIDVSTGEDKGEEVRRTTTKISLSTLAEGDYEIRVMALSKDEELNNKWSEKIYFHKNYETGCVYTLINDETEYRLTRYGSAPETIYIEDEYRGKPVTEIGARAFKGYAVIQHVEIGDNVRLIDDNAFYGCKYLKTIEFGESVAEIGVSAFQSCSALESIVLPASLTTIENSAFSYCRGLEEIVMPEGIQSIGTYAFSDCSGLKKIELPDSLMSLGDAAFTVSTSLEKVSFGKNLTSIAASAFYKCTSLKDILFAEENSVTVIESNAFGDCFALESVTIPEGVEQIAANAFKMSILEEIDEAEDSTETTTIVYTVQSKLQTIKIPSTITSIGTNAFYGTKYYMDALQGENSYIYVGNWVVGATPDLKETLETLPYNAFKEGTYGIADSALMNFAKLGKICLPNSIRYIGGAGFQSNLKLRIFETTDDSELLVVGMYALAGCSILDTVILGPKVVTIEEGAFAACARLDNTEDNILTPDKVSKVGKDAFAGTKLMEFPDEFGVVYAGNWLVGYDTDATVTRVELRTDTVGIADYAFANSEELKSIIVPNNNDLKYIGRGAFCRCLQLDMLDLSYTNVRRIEDYTFYACGALSYVSLPTRLTSIGRSAFYNCFQLKKVDLSKTYVSEIGRTAFFSCSNLEEVLLGDKLKTIDVGAFYFCGSLKKVDFPDTLTSISDYAFFACQSLENVTFGSNIKSIGNYVFAHANAIKRLSFSGELKTIGDYAFYCCEGVSLITLNEGLESIGDYAFLNTKSVKSLSLPSSLKSVGDYAFAYNVELKSLILDKNIQTLGQHVFYGNTNLTLYIVGEEIPEGWERDWNSSFHPVFMGCNLSGKGDYVVSITITENKMQNVWSAENLMPPQRLGKEFMGWSTSTTGDVIYTMQDILNAGEGEVLYAIWSQE